MFTFIICFCLCSSAFYVDAASFVSGFEGKSQASGNHKLQMVTTNSVLDQYSPRQLIDLGMRRFRSGDVIGSIECFDSAEHKDSSIRPYLWQRGLSYYYADMFQLGSDQFRFDVSVNPLDVEEIVWDIACLARIDGKNLDQSKMMSLPKGKKDRRKIMATVYQLFRGENGVMEEDLAKAGELSASDEFYSNFYLGLYTESVTGDISKASHYMVAAASSAYSNGVGSADYMTACAKVHCKLRGWKIS
mmetsp:Transcript_17087/g.22178  ORF Transcript_17087/g.22178 Transcript_17087/m.22178 type:complete len:246 (+) Transcript_17087:114-851(+)|eukprot:CAMPEP_0116064864 /NCGR_PEP_ID=MMETSP0322-20121206/9375_1 /TAXON_ID=163516 /ORGANISM="Leptocylindrus danicus var. apora, Strain B651" /LENGTH=245 /DNA_ID=CAMNT_0003550977 /DNA_START=9 /DNA_END=746 /DNA_ORIENTATION=+